MSKEIKLFSLATKEGKVLALMDKGCCDHKWGRNCYGAVIPGTDAAYYESLQISGLDPTNWLEDLKAGRREPYFKICSRSEFSFKFSEMEVVTLEGTR